MERTQTNNAAKAIRLLCGFSLGRSITVRLRHEDAKRPGMASYAEGIISGVTSLPDGDLQIEMPVGRTFKLSTIEAIEIKGGLGDARKAAQ